MQLDLTFSGRLQIPLIVAPMFLVSSPEMALAACSRGIMGSFPAHSTRNREQFVEWLEQMGKGLQEIRKQGKNPAPYAVNLVVHDSNKRYPGDLDLCIEHGVEVILTSKGAPVDVVERVHAYGGVVFHDVASHRHAEKALQAGVDGLIAVCAGAGGHTGQLNPFALVNELRQLTEKPIILAGALSTGRDLLTAQAMGADMAYMGTRFIACPESLAETAYALMLVDSFAKDVLFSTELDGYPTNVLIPSLQNAGLKLEELASLRLDPEKRMVVAKACFRTIWSSGQGVGLVKSIQTTEQVCDELIQQYAQAKITLRELTAELPSRKTSDLPN